MAETKQRQIAGLDTIQTQLTPERLYIRRRKEYKRGVILQLTAAGEECGGAEALGHELSWASQWAERRTGIAGFCNRPSSMADPLMRS